MGHRKTDPCTIRLSGSTCNANPDHLTCWQHIYASRVVGIIRVASDVVCEVPGWPGVATADRGDRNSLPLPVCFLTSQAYW